MLSVRYFFARVMATYISLRSSSSPVSMQALFVGNDVVFQPDEVSRP